MASVCFGLNFTRVVLMVIDLHNSDEFIYNAIKESKRNSVEAHVRVFTKRGKSSIRTMIRAFLEKNNLPEEYHNDVIESLFELIYNALKANYSHIYSIQMLTMKFPEITDAMDNGFLLLLDEEMRQQYLSLRKSPFVKDIVKTLMKLEANLIKEWDAGGVIDTSKYEALHSFKRILEKPVRIKIRLSRQDHLIKCSVFNQAPITLLDLSRVRQKRMIFREYYNRGVLHKFYEENLDESESAGFGATLIDLRLLEMGLEPYDHFTLITDGFTTKASIRFVVDDFDDDNPSAAGNTEGLQY